MPRRPTHRKRDRLAFGADTYRAGAAERLEDARLLKDRGNPALSMYTGGLAVEGMLRALCCLKSREFDEKHDLRKFAVRVEDLGLLRPARDDDFVTAVQKLGRQWRRSA